MRTKQILFATFTGAIVALVWTAAADELLWSSASSLPTTETFLIDAKSGDMRTVPDPAARAGWAIRAERSASNREQCVKGTYSYNHVAGRLRGIVRLKVADNTSAQPVAVIEGHIYERSPAPDVGPLTPKRSICGTDFKAPNTYQEFAVEIARGEKGFGCWVVLTEGRTTLWYDGLVVEQVSRLTDADLIPLANVPPKPPNLKVGFSKTNGNDRIAGPHVHETHGLFMEKWGVRAAVDRLLDAPLLHEQAHAWSRDAVVAMGLRDAHLEFGRTREAVDRLPRPTGMADGWTESYFQFHEQKTQMTGFPETWEDLYRNSVVVLNNVPRKALSLADLLRLKQYVMDGGTLVMMGDTHGLIMGQWADSFLASLLPVAMAPNDGVYHAASPLQLKPRDNRLNDLDWKAMPCTVYYHKIAVCPGAKIWVTAGDRPMVVESQVGKGRVVVMLLSVMGDAEKAGAPLPFWEWKDWPELMARVLFPKSGS